MFREKKRYGQDPNVVVRSKTTFTAPLKWKDPARVFTCSWSDWFIEEADAWRDEAWAIIERTPHLTYQILTKRPERIAGRLPWTDTPWSNVWLGVSAEDQATFNARWPILRRTPAATRFLSLEPLLGGIDLQPALYEYLDHWVWPQWIITGGESGPDARPSHPGWFRAIRDHAVGAGIPFHFKQWGEYAVVPKRQEGIGRMVRAGDVVVTAEGQRAEIKSNLSCDLEGQGVPMRRVGVRTAGHVLDGRTWHEFPR